MTAKRFYLSFLLCLTCSVAHSQPVNISDLLKVIQYDNLGQVDMAIQGIGFEFYKNHNANEDLNGMAITTYCYNRINNTAESWLTIYVRDNVVHKVSLQLSNPEWNINLMNSLENAGLKYISIEFQEGSKTTKYENKSCYFNVEVQGSSAGSASHFYDVIRKAGQYDDQNGQKQIYYGATLSTYGVMSKKYSLKNGVNHGDYIRYHRNGQLFEKYKYVDGRMHGWYRQYDQSGNLVEIRFYKNNSIEGELKAYKYSNDTLVESEVSIYRFNNRNGRCLYYKHFADCTSSKKLDYWFTPNLSKIGDLVKHVV